MSQTVIEILLLDKDLKRVGSAQVNFPKTLQSNSDMAQKMDGFILERWGKYYTYHRITGQMMCSFKERQVLCV